MVLCRASEMHSDIRGKAWGTRRAPPAGREESGALRQQGRPCLRPPRGQSAAAVATRRQHGPHLKLKSKHPFRRTAGPSLHLLWFLRQAGTTCWCGWRKAPQDRRGQPAPLRAPVLPNPCAVIPACATPHGGAPGLPVRALCLSLCVYLELISKCLLQDRALPTETFNTCSTKPRRDLGWRPRCLGLIPAGGNTGVTWG